jgi:hypothetical protein
MIKPYVLYLKKCPGILDPRDFKVGITQLSSTRTRLASYQTAVGPVYEESFIRAWVGDENQVRMAEKEFKRNFADKISSAEAGLSEWICDLTLEVLLAFVNELREEYFIKLIDAPSEYLPLTMPLCEDLEKWYNGEMNV